MSVDPRFGRYCDECGRTIKKAHRVFGEKDFCSSCYPRVFVASSCTQCARRVRLHRLATEPAICRACEAATRTCMRCGKPTPRAGLYSAGKPVCPSCAPYFREPAPCTACGKLTARLSSMPSAGILEKICEACRNKVTHRTCAACGKYRKVAGTLRGDRPCCVACLENPGATHPCPDCSLSVPGVGNARCRGCQNRSLLFRESGMAAHALAHPWARDLYLQFAMWLHQRQPASPRLLSTFRSHHSFFERIDTQYVERGDLTPLSMLRAFGPAKLRKHLLVMHFLDATLGLAMTEQDKAEFADQERIVAKISGSSRRPWGNVVAEYAAALAQSGVAVRTRRMYISSAEAFCNAVAFNNDVPWAEEDARRFLKKKPGSRANLTKFFSFCRQTYGWSVAIPPAKPPNIASKPPRTVNELKRLLKEMKAAGIENTRTETLAKIIAKSFDLRISTVMSLSPTQFLEKAGRLVLNVNTELIDVPAQLEEITRSYAARLAMSPSG
jgi:hypothetical protein